MRYLMRIAELAILILLIAVTVQNSTVVEFKLFFGHAWQAPLIVFLLLFFVLGAALGMLSMLSYYLKMRKELSDLKKEIRTKNNTHVHSDPSDALAD